MEYLLTENGKKNFYDTPKESKFLIKMAEILEKTIQTTT
ncbi:MAG: hypothetical protein ACI8W0_001887 [Flavobacterium sp.]|jgi:hypothetical protein